MQVLRKPARFFKHSRFRISQNYIRRKLCGTRHFHFAAVPIHLVLRGTLLRLSGRSRDCSTAELPMQYFCEAGNSQRVQKRQVQRVFHRTGIFRQAGLLLKVYDGRCLLDEHRVQDLVETGSQKPVQENPPLWLHRQLERAQHRPHFYQICRFSACLIETDINWKRYYFFGGFSPDCQNDPELCSSLYYFDLPSYPRKYAKDPFDYTKYFDQIEAVKVPNSHLPNGGMGCSLEYNEILNSFALYSGYRNGKNISKYLKFEVSFRIKFTFLIWETRHGQNFSTKKQLRGQSNSTMRKCTRSKSLFQRLFLVSIPLFCFSSISLQSKEGSHCTKTNLNRTPNYGSQT